MANQEERNRQMQQIIAKCWSDEAFKKKLVADPQPVDRSLEPYWLGQDTKASVIMKKFILIISSILLLGFASGANAGSCWDGDFNDCNVKAETGDAAAQMKLGWMYANGKGVSQDYEKAFEWWSKAAEQGNTGAQFHLGWMYANGKGVPKDYVMAHMFLSIAGANGDKYIQSAAKHRGIVAKKMSSSQIEKAQDLAREWMQKHP